MPEQVKCVLQMKGISKSFPGIKALDKVDFELLNGEVHVLMGENGAGKSTLMKILGGDYQMDEGEIFIEGQRVHLSSAHTARKHGVAFVHQELMIADNMTAAQNVFMGNEVFSNQKLKFLDNAQMNQRADEVINGALHCGIDVTVPVVNLSVAQKQLLEIARALITGANIIILDEPTSSLPQKDIDTLFNLIHKLKADGKTIVYISHRMEEIREIGDRVTVMRDGHIIGTRLISEVSIDDLITMMVGRKLENQYPERNVKIGDVVLSVRNVSCTGKVENISFDVHAGEVVGFYGLIGSGRTEFARAIFGADPKDSGKVFVNGKEVLIHSCNDAIRAGICLIPEERKKDGLIGIMNVSFNSTLPILDKMRRRFLISRKKQNNVADKFVKMLSIKTPNVYRTVRNLSGGNQQKVVISKWLASDSKVFIFDEPTRGIDVGAKSEIYGIMNQLLADGAAIVMISSEMPELLGVADRIFAMRQGRIAGEFNAKSVTQEEILKCAL